MWIWSQSPWFEPNRINMVQIERLVPQRRAVTQYAEWKTNYIFEDVGTCRVRGGQHSLSKKIWIYEGSGQFGDSLEGVVDPIFINLNLYMI